MKAQKIQIWPAVHIKQIQIFKVEGVASWSSDSSSNGTESQEDSEDDEETGHFMSECAPMQFDPDKPWIIPSPKMPSKLASSSKITVYIPYVYNLKDRYND